MKKLTIKSTLIFCAILFLVSINVSIADSEIKIGSCKAIANGGDVTCYSTYLPCDDETENCWTLWRCGTCGSIQAEEYQDPNTCTPDLEVD